MKKIRINSKIIFLVCFFNISIILNLSGQEKYEYKFYHISVEQGLSQSAVTCMLQDKDGFLWFGTQNGLNKYDGSQFINKQFRFSEFISCLCQDSSRNIWIGTEAGVVHKFDILKEKFTRQDSIKIGPYRISSIYFDKSSNLIWVGSEGGGLIIFDINTNKILKNDKSSWPKIYAINKDNYGIFWLGTEQGPKLVQFDKEKKYLFTQASKPLIAQGDTTFKHDEVKVIFINKSQKIWIGTSDNYLFELNPIEKDSTVKFESTQYDSSDSLMSKNITSIFQDSYNNIWIATSDSGLYMSSIPNIKINKFNNYKRNPFDKYSLSYNEVTSILQDNTGILWFGTLGGGVNKLKQEKFKHYYHIANDKESLQDDTIWSFYQDNPDILWIGTNSKGVLRFEVKKQNFESREPITKLVGGKKIRSIFPFNENKLWLGTYGDGIYELNKTEFSIKEKSKHFPEFLHVMRIIEDQDSTVWIATLDSGVYYFNKKNKKLGHPITSKKIYTIFEDKRNNIWLGTLGEGLIRLNKNNPEENDSFTVENGLSSNNVYSIVQENTGMLWVGTSNGLNKFNGDSVLLKITVGDTFLLPDNLIYGMLMDKQKNIWISTNKELTYFNTQKNKAIFNYGIEDGIQGYEFNGGAYFQYDSLMYIGGISGFNRFSPERVTRVHNKPPLFITRLITSKGKTKIDSNITNVESIKLSSDQRSFSLQFAELDYTAPSSIIYYYMLIDYDKTWNFADKSKKADYFNVKNGTYTFKVKGSNNGDTFQADSLRIKIEPYRWQKYQYPIIFIIGFIIFLLFMTYKGRKKYFDDIKRLKEIGKGITITSDLQKNLKQIYELVRKSMDASTFAIITYDKDLQALHYDLFIEEGNEEKAPPIPLSKKNRFGVYCFEHQVKIVMNNVSKQYNSNEFSVSFEIKPIVGKTPESLIYLPLIVEGKCIGAITVQSLKKNSYKKNNIIWLENLASYVAIALENARVNRENELRLHELKAANEKLKELDQRKSHFLKIASHAIGSPLSPVVISLKEMQSDISKVKEEELKKAYIRLKQVLNTINNLLNLSKIEDNVINQKLSFKSVKNVLLKTIPIFEIEADIEKINFSFSLPEKDLLKTMINEIFIEQIVFNLLSNAIKFTKPKSDRVVNLTAVREDTNIKVTISDNGIGIAEEQRDKIFEKFYKIDTSSAVGAGLGLSIVKYLVVELHKGQIHVVSKLNFGSTFAFTIPIREDI